MLAAMVTEGMAAATVDMEVAMEDTAAAMATEEWDTADLADMVEDRGDHTPQVMVTEAMEEDMVAITMEIVMAEVDRAHTATVESEESEVSVEWTDSDMGKIITTQEDTVIAFMKPEDQEMLTGELQ